MMKTLTQINELVHVLDLINKESELTFYLFGYKLGCLWCRNKTEDEVRLEIAREKFDLDPFEPKRQSNGRISGMTWVLDEEKRERKQGK